MVVVNIYIRVLQLQLPVNSTDQVPANAQLNQIKNLSEYAFIVPRTNRSRDGSRSEPPAPFISSGSSSSEARNRSEPGADRARARIDPGIGGLGEQIDPCTLSGANPSDGQRNRRRGVGALPAQELATSTEP